MKMNSTYKKMRYLRLFAIMIFLSFNSGVSFAQVSFETINGGSVSTTICKENEKYIVSHDNPCDPGNIYCVLQVKYNNDNVVTNSNWTINVGSGITKYTDWKAGFYAKKGVSLYSIELDVSNKICNVNLSSSSSCGPTVGTLAAPAAVCDGETLNATPPTISGATSQGWQICATENGTYTTWTNGSVVTMSQNGYYLRYWASDGSTTNYSNAEQITVNPYITLNSLTSSTEHYCSGTTLTADVDDETCLTSNSYTKEFEWHNASGVLATNTSSTYTVPAAGTYHVVVKVKNGGSVIKSYTSENVTIAPSTFGAGDVTYTATPFCNGSSTVTLSAPDYCPNDGYPIYWLYNAGDGLEVHHNTTGSFPGVAKAGSYYAIIEVDGSTSVRKDGIMVNAPSITLSTSASSLSFANETWGDEVTKNITATVTGTYCGDLSVSAVSSNDKFTVGTIVNNGDGTFTIPVTYNETETENSYVGTLTVTAQTNAYSPSLTPATDSKTISLSGTTTCEPPTIAIGKMWNVTSISATTACGCNGSWFAKVTPKDQYNQSSFYFTINGENYDKSTADVAILINDEDFTESYTWDVYNCTGFYKKVNTADDFYLYLKRTKSGYKLEITSEEPTCSPTVANVNIPDVCKNTVIDLSGYVPSYTAAGTVTDEGWEYSTTGGEPWSSVASPAAFTVDKEYYVRYYVTDENGPGHSEVAQINFKTSTIGTLAGFTETAYCTGTTINLTTDPGAPSYTAADCGTPTVGFEYSSDNGSTYTAVADPANFSLATAGTYKVRYKVTTNNGTDYSNVSTLTIVGAPAVAEMVIPAAICDGGTLTLTEPNINSYYIHDDGWEISTNGGLTYSDFNPSTTLSSATYNGALLRYTSTNVCGTNSNTPRTITVNVPTVDIVSVATRKGASGFVQVVATPTTTSSCVNEIVYSIASAVNESSANSSSYFTINTETGVVSTTNTIPSGIYTVVIRAQNGTNSVSDTYEVEIEIADRASMNFTCPDAVVTNRCTTDKEITYTLATSSMRNDKISFALTGTAAKYFTVSPSTFTPSANIGAGTSQTITVTQSKALAAGTYNLTLTASANTDAYGTVTASCEGLSITVSKYDDAIGAAITTSTGATTAEVFCSQELGVKATSVATDVLRYDWYVNGVKQATSSTPSASVSFDCSDAPATIPVKVVMQNENGCLDEATLNVTVKEYSTTYYYWGPTGSSAELYNPDYWSSCSKFNYIENYQQKTKKCFGAFFVNVGNSRL